jgi:hypothetical protein
MGSFTGYKAYRVLFRWRFPGREPEDRELDRGSTGLKIAKSHPNPEPNSAIASGLRSAGNIILLAFKTIAYSGGSLLLKCFWFPGFCL